MGGLLNVKSPVNVGLGTGVAGKLLEWTGEASHTSGDVRLIYMTLNLRGTGGDGESFRPRTLVYGTGLNSAHGTHCTLQIAVGGAISGLGCGMRTTFEAAAATRTLTGTLCSLQVDSNIGANNTLPASHALIRLTNVGSVAMTNAFEIPTASNGTMVAAHTTDAMSHSIKCRQADGTATYIMCTTTATNRS